MIQHIILLVATISWKWTGVIGVWSETPSYYGDGDIIIAGMFPLHYGTIRLDDYNLLQEPEQPVCQNYNFLGFRWMQAMLFAIEEANNRTDILNQTKIGFQIFDTCNTLSRAVSQTIEITSQSNPKPVAVVGATGSDNSIGIANTLGVYDVPQISYGSTTRRLSNKNLYNAFLRTIPNDDEQAVAMVDLLIEFEWTWVGAIAGNDEYGRSGLSKFIAAATAHNICVEFVKYVDEGMSDDEVEQTVNRIKAFNATAFVVFSSFPPFKKVAAQLKKQQVNDKVWIASEAWATSTKTFHAGGQSLYGTLGIATRSGSMPNYRQYLENVSPDTQNDNPFLREFWEESFYCACPSNVCKTLETTDLHASTHRAIDNRCTGKENVKEITNPQGFSYLGWKMDELEKSYTTYLAVYAIIHALNNIETCRDGTGLLKDGKCPDIKNLQPWQLLLYAKNVSFPQLGEELPFEFNKDGDPNATYKLVNWVPSDNGGVKFECIGNYSRKLTPKWRLNKSKIYWSNFQNLSADGQAPASVCSQECKPGFYKVKLSSICCYKCIRCPNGEFSTTINQPSCYKCNTSLTSNDNHTDCIPKYEEYMRWNDVFGIVIACCAAAGIILTLFAAVTFIRHWNTPIVKATNREISMFLFVAILCCFTTPFFYIAKPSNWSCRARQVVFLLSFTACISAILVKTLRVVNVFNSSKFIRQQRLNTYLKEHKQILIVLLISLGQFMLCVVWLVVAPPSMTENQEDPMVARIECVNGPLGFIISVHLYIVILAMLAFVMAFRARKLPENFNEAKFITFAMLIFFIVWVSFIPAYLTTTGHLQSVCYSLAILTSTFAILICIFFPKLYVMLVTPSRNTTEQVRINTVNHAFRSASRSIQYKMKVESKNEEKGSSQNNNIISMPTTVTNVSLNPSMCVDSCITDGTPTLSMKQLHVRKRQRTKKAFSTQYKSTNTSESNSSNELDIRINHEVKASTVQESLEDDLNKVRTKSSASFDVTFRVDVTARKRRKLQRCLSEDLIGNGTKKDRSMCTASSASFNYGSWRNDL